jgi:hypothetical protein
MKTLAVDKYQRIRLPDAKGGQKFAYSNNGDGTLTLTLVKPVESAPAKVRFVKRGRFTVGILNRPIDPDALREALADFP